MKKRILASLLSLCLIVGLLPTAVLAADEIGTEGEMPAVCTCTALCTEGSVDETCPVCAEDYNSCACEEAPTEPVEEPGDEPVEAVSYTHLDVYKRQLLVLGKEKNTLPGIAYREQLKEDIAKLIEHLEAFQRVL